MSNIIPADYCHKTVELARKSSVMLANRIYTIRENKLWAGVWDSFEDFLETIPMSTATASKLCSMYEVLCITYGFPVKALEEAPWSHVYAFLPLMKTKELATEYLNKAKVMNREMVKEEVLDAEGLGDCRHPKDDQSGPYNYCHRCKRFHKIHD